MFIVHLNISKKYTRFINFSMYPMKLQLSRNIITVITNTKPTKKNTNSLTSASSNVAPR